MPTSIKDEIKTKGFENEHQMLMVNLLYTSNWIDCKSSVVFKANGITNTQYNILRILNGSHPKPLSAGDIKERILFKQTDITRVIDRLVDKKYVSRELCEENRRKMDIVITNSGKELLFKIGNEMKEVAKEFIGNISKEEAVLASEILDKLRG